ncbi:MAG: hypothetical protein PF505_12980 [Vallitaleaceae bacterium]|jgi:hypothetical protein|nr:hypothetical protein [Vallitaleaceae bacterium]
MKKRMIMIVLLMALMLLILTGCLPGDGTYTDGHMANFLSGVWHGWLAPLSLILGLFNKSHRIYEVYNTGWWYDLGFYIAIVGGFGGFALSRKKKRKED